MNLKNIFLTFLISILGSPQIFAQPSIDSNSVYPFGKKFPLGLYSFHDTIAPGNGWSAGHNYFPNVKTLDSTLNMFKKMEMMGFGGLGYTYDSLGNKVGLEEQDISAQIKIEANNGNICWYEIPEECRYWRTPEFDIVKNYSSWTRKYDTLKRPNFMYIPGNYSQTAIEYYVDYLDIIPASAYRTYNKSSPIFVRYIIKNTIDAITAKGKVIGKDYLNGEKTVMSVIELFGDGAGMTAVGSRHDFWASLASGAQGIIVYSHFYRNANSTLKACWEEMNLSAKQFTEAKLGNPILFGTPYSIGMKVTNGPKLTGPGIYYDTTINYPSINLIAKTFEDTLYIIAVNSNESSTKITSEFTGLPTSLDSGTVLFEKRVVAITNGILTDTFEPLEVHVYKIPLTVLTSKSDNLNHSEIFVSINPNPAYQYIDIKYKLDKQSTVKIWINDITGRNLIRIAEEYSSGEHQCPINIEQLPAGYYLVTININDKEMTKKLIVID